MNQALVDNWLKNVDYFHDEIIKLFELYEKKKIMIGVKEDELNIIENLMDQCFSEVRRCKEYFNGNNPYDTTKTRDEMIGELFDLFVKLSFRIKVFNFLN